MNNGTEETMENAIQKTETNLPTTASVQGPETLASDLVVPRLLLMQPMSDFVTEGLVTPDGKSIAPGQVIRTTTRELVGAKGQPIELAPISYINEWHHSQKVGEKFEWRSRTPRTAKNERLDFLWKEADGSEWKRTKVITLMALLVSDVEKELAEIKKCQETGELPDLNNMLLPVVIGFKSMSFNAGQAVATHFARAQSLGMPQAAQGTSLKFDVEFQKNDKGAFYVYKALPGRKLPAEVAAVVQKWALTLASRNVRVDGGEEGEESTPAQAVSGSAAPGDQF